MRGDMTSIEFDLSANSPQGCRGQMRPMSSQLMTITPYFSFPYIAQHVAILSACIKVSKYKASVKQNTANML